MIEASIRGAGWLLVVGVAMWFIELYVRHAVRDRWSTRKTVIVFGVVVLWPLLTLILYLKGVR